MIKKKLRNKTKQTPTPVSKPKPESTYRSKTFDYSVDYRKCDLRKNPELYRVGRGEQGVLLVEPYKSEILPHWKFVNPHAAKVSSAAIRKLFFRYKSENDFVGMDMARKFLQMGYTRARRYANHASGKKYSADGKLLPYSNDETKAKSAEVFYKVWKKIESDPDYKKQKAEHKVRLG